MSYLRYMDKVFIIYDTTVKNCFNTLRLVKALRNSDKDIYLVRSKCDQFEKKKE